jgi:hypothetical protein
MKGRLFLSALAAMALPTWLAAAPVREPTAEQKAKALASDVALAVEAGIAVLILLVLIGLFREGWSLRAALSEATTATIATSEDSKVIVTMTPSSSRLTALIGTILFTALAAPCIGITVGALVAGTKADLANATSLFIAIGGFFGPYVANKLASAVAGTSRPGVQSNWRVLEGSSGGFEVGREEHRRSSGPSLVGKPD